MGVQLNRQSADLAAPPPCTHGHHGIRVYLDWTYHRLAHAANRAIAQQTAAFPQAAALYAQLLTDPQVLAMWDMTNYMAVEKLAFNDHGQAHAQIVAAHALTLLQLLQQAGIEPDVVTSGAGTLADANLVVLAAALLHDIGNQVARDNHELYGVGLAQPVLARLLPTLYDDPAQIQLLTSFILGAIASHDCSPPPLSLEGAIVAVADAADMTRGRGQVAFDQGKADIHAISAMAVETVTIQKGDASPALIQVQMTNPAGLFQVEKLLMRKMQISGLERYVGLQVCTIGTDHTGEDVRCLVLHQGRFELQDAPRVGPVKQVVDPVCGMVLTPQTATGRFRFGDQVYYFCSNACLTEFTENPTRRAPSEGSS